MVKFTDKAIQAVRDFIKNEEKGGHGLRVAIVGGGCSGFQYDLALSRKPSDNDEVYSFGDLSVYVDKNSLPHLSGTTVDYVNDLRGSGFIFQNPNANSTCGCGHSFDA